MRKAILLAVDDAVLAIESLRSEEAISFIEMGSKMIANCFRSGNKLLICGNGGSLCDAMHFAEELTGFYRQKRSALPAIALCDPGHLTCVGNDDSFEEIFSRGVEAFGLPGDILIVLTTSGNSKNILSAVRKAKEKGLKVIAFLGKTGGKLKNEADLEWIVSGFSWSDRIQEAHMTAIHIMIEQIEKELFEFEELNTGILDKLNREYKL